MVASRTTVPGGTWRRPPSLSSIASCFPVLAPLGSHEAAVVEVEKGVEALIDDEDHVAAASPVASVGSAAGHEFLTPE